MNPNHRRKDPSLPKRLRVRVIGVPVPTGKNPRRPMWFVTSLLDPVMYPAEEIVELYARRWRIEMLFRDLKVNLHAADEHDADPMRLPFAGAVRVALTFSGHFATAPPWKLPLLNAALIRQIAQRQLPDRPNRLEPRAIQREKKEYPRLRITRKKWRQQWLQSQVE